MSNYPKALEEFLKTVPSEFKEQFDKLAQTETGSRVVNASKDVSEYFFHPDEKRKDEIDGQASIDDDGTLKVMMTKGYMNDIEKNSLLFATLLMHELGHIEQMENIARAKDLPRTKRAVYGENPDEKEGARNIARECDADRKALDMVNEARIDKNTEQFKEVEKFLTAKYGNNFNVNLSYSDMTQNYAKENDLKALKIKREGYDNHLVKKLVESGRFNKEIIDNFINGQKANAQEFINDSEVKDYEFMMLNGKKSETFLSNLDFRKKDLKGRKDKNSSSRARLDAIRSGNKEEEVKSVNPLSRNVGRE